VLLRGKKRELLIDAFVTKSRIKFPFRATLNVTERGNIFYEQEGKIYAHVAYGYFAVAGAVGGICFTILLAVRRNLPDNFQPLHLDNIRLGGRTSAGVHRKPVRKKIRLRKGKAYELSCNLYRGTHHFHIPLRSAAAAGLYLYFAEEKRTEKEPHSFNAVGFVAGFIRSFSCFLGVFASSAGGFLIRHKTAVNLITGAIVNIVRLKLFRRC
jgi:hypothetical protein